MSTDKKLVASCSFGKDSLTAIITAEEHGHHIDEAIYCRIMFDDKISAELPEHEEFIHTKAIPLLESRYGIKTTIVQASETYCSRFFSVFQERSRKCGQIYGFPMRQGAWCNSHLKVRPITKWQQLAGEYTAVVGIAADEEKRIHRKTEKDKFLPLVQYGITENEAFRICSRGGASRQHITTDAPGWAAGFATTSASTNCADSGKSTRNYGRDFWSWTQ